MHAKTLVPDAKHLRCDGVQWNGSQVMIRVSCVAVTATCPTCGHVSNRVHSRYERRLQDLPWQGLRVMVLWTSRRWFCDQDECPHRIFTERLPEVGAPHARKTQRLVTILRAVAMACGGEAGAELARRLEMPTSPDTLLRELRRGADEPQGRVRVVGVDDWALRRGQRYGTILVDLEAHRVVDLLPERSSESVAAWLRQHPEVEVVSRDRGEYYIKGATLGAPQAIQVADRWNLLHNLHETLIRVIDRNLGELRQAARCLAHDELAPRRTSTSLPPAPTPEPELAGTPRRLHLQEKYQRLVELRKHKHSMRAIARELELDRGTVRRWINMKCLPPIGRRGPHSRPGAYLSYLESRWNAGCRNAAALASELRDRGYQGSYDSVRRLLGKWRKLKASERSKAVRHTSQPSAKAIAWWLLKPLTGRTPEQQRLVELFRATCPAVERAASLSDEFTRVVRERLAGALEPWIEEALAPESPIDLRRFAKGLRDDLAAVTAALTMSWSNGQTEGQVNRLKLIKRQMFGRAKFDLLRRRVLNRQV